MIAICYNRVIEYVRQFDDFKSILSAEDKFGADVNGIIKYETKSSI